MEKDYRAAVREGRLPSGDSYPLWLDRVVDYGILLLFPLTGLMVCLALIFASLWTIIWVVRNL